MAQQDLLRQLELEKQKREMNRKIQGEPERPMAPARTIQEDHSPAWELELEAYRAQKKRESFYRFGAWCGIVGLLIEISTHGPQWVQWIAKLLGKA